MDDPVFCVDGIIVTGWAGGLETAALIDRNVDDDRSRAHSLDHVFSHDLRRGSARHQYGSNHQVGVADVAFDGVNRRVYGVQLGPIASSWDRVQ